MDRRERVGDPLVSLLAAFDGALAQVWTALPAKVVSFDATEQAASLQALVQISMLQTDGSEKWLTIPPLLDVPVYFPSAGGVTLTFPVKPGDEGLVVFSSRCIDAWWQLGPDQPQVQAEKRLHSLSDGMFFPGFKSRPKVIANVSTTTAQFRSDSGATYVEVDPADGFVTVKTPGNINAQAGGNINAQATGQITAQAGGDIDATAGGNANVNASGSINMTAPNIVANGHFTVNGATTLNGPISQGAGAGGTNASLIGPLAVTNDVTGMGKSVGTHTHNDPQGGVTGGPN